MHQLQAHPYRINQLLNSPEKLSTPLANISILIVGVGGIGCQILKVLCKTPIGTTHIIDMDTIQLSNLNRQFLFKHQHKGMSKSLVARQTVLKLNPNFNVVAHHKNIKELPINFFKQFNYLIMALDNVEARNYVNKIGIRLSIPIIDAGTLAYKGNVTTIIPRQTRCYSCQPKSSQQKVFPVCTIRMRPQKPIHCIVWAKLLFEALFGPENQDNDLKDLSELAKNEDIVQIMSKLFEKDILDIKNAKSESDNKLSEIFARSIKVIQKEAIQKSIGQAIIDSFSDHQVKQGPEKNLSIFAESFLRLSKQKIKDGMITFEKDDDNIIHFIASGANLRMHCFSIEEQTFNEVKNMAGNIVPAIASTNSIVSGIQIAEMMKHIKMEQSKMKSFFIQNQNNKIIPLALQKSFPTCQVCHDSAIPVIVEVDLTKFTLQNLVSLVTSKLSSLQEFSINQASKQFYNSDDPKQKLLEKSLFELCDSLQVDLILTDQNQSKKVCLIWLVHNEQIKAEEPIIKNQEQFFRKEESKPTEQPRQNGIQSNDDQVIMFDDQSPQVEILQVKRKEPVVQSTHLAESVQPIVPNQIEQEVKQAQEDAIIQNGHGNCKENGIHNLENGQVKQNGFIQNDTQENHNEQYQDRKIAEVEQPKPVENQEEVKRIGDGPEEIEEGESDVIKKKVKIDESMNE